MRLRTSNWVLLFGSLACLAGLQSDARAGYISDLSQMSDFANVSQFDVSQFNGSQSSSAAVPQSKEQPQQSPQELLRQLLEADSSGNITAGSGIGTPSVSGSSSPVGTAGLLLPLEIPEIQLRSWLAVAATSSRAPPHVDRLFRPPRCLG